MYKECTYVCPSATQELKLLNILKPISAQSTFEVRHKFKRVQNRMTKFNLIPTGATKQNFKR